MIQTVSGQILQDKVKNFDIILKNSKEVGYIDVYHNGKVIYKTNDFSFLEEALKDEESINFFIKNFIGKTL